MLDLLRMHQAINEGGMNETTGCGRYAPKLSEQQKATLIADIQSNMRQCDIGRKHGVSRNIVRHYQDKMNQHDTRTSQQD